MEPPVHELTPFPTPPPPPRSGIVGWLQQCISRRSVQPVHGLPTSAAPPPALSAPPHSRQRRVHQHVHAHRTQQHMHRHPDSVPSPPPMAAVNVVAKESPEGSRCARRVNSPEPTATAVFSPPSASSSWCPGPSAGYGDGNDGDTSTHTSGSSLLQSSLPDTAGSTDSLTPDIAHMASSRRPSATSLPDVEVFTAQTAVAAAGNERGGGGKDKKPAAGTGARAFDDALTRLVRHEVSGLLPFLIFLLSMPFLGVATHAASVAALGHGIKRAIGCVRIEGGRRVAYSPPPPPPPQQQQQKQQKQRGQDNEREEEKMVRGQGKEVVGGDQPPLIYGVECTACRLGVEAIGALPPAARGRVAVDKGKRRAEVSVCMCG